MEQKELNYLINQDEGENLDFKLQLQLISESQKHELAKDVSSMANTRGGHIIIGVDDKTSKPIGVSPGSIDYDNIQQIVSSRLAPPVCFNCHSFKLPNGKQITVIEIPNSPLKPHQDLQKGIFWIRRGAIVDWAREPEIENMKREARLLQRARLSEEAITPRMTKEVSLIAHQDNRIFIFGEKPVPYRKIGKTGFLSRVALCPVFLPEFNVIPPPEFGHKSVAYVTSESLGYHELTNFSGFIENVEKIWQLLGHKILLETRGPFYWTISSNEFMTYGCGAQNLIRAMKKYDYGTIGAVLQGVFGEHYFRTCFLVVGAYWKGGRVRNVEMDMYLACIPTNWSWINHLYDSFKYMNESEIRPNNFTAIDLPFAWWFPNREKIDPKILGGLRRIGFGEERGYDNFSGVITADQVLKTVRYELSPDSWHVDSFQNTKCPLYHLEEAVVSLTNPPPFCDEIESGKVKMITAPQVKGVLFPKAGFTIIGINLHSYPIFEQEMLV